MKHNVSSEYGMGDRIVNAALAPKKNITFSIFSVIQVVCLRLLIICQRRKAVIRKYCNEPTLYEKLKCSN